ncbi:LysR substrate-binding domain-containing protein [Thalassotalea sp. PS06]|uniref:LysR substrate-binding domain-containing protein n=1 Tax=Thalassotalea sp. PS06 TaxID=2594005 RepID=UPI00116229A3|nr:LysR substrate-binding domain-containing protein [Thalassotalea sp. PS06]QDP00795.1 LysR family transcriptional regulator [Thalassotalea sp. PS06]
MNNHLPNLKHLQYLLALHRHQHFHKAAESCFVSQSTLSSAIIKLEQLLNCQLIERDHKNFLFTRQGIEVVHMAEQLLHQADELVDYCLAQGNPTQGKLYLGCIPTIAPFLMTDVIEKTQQDCQHLELYVIEDTTENLLASLQGGKIDAAILALPIDEKFTQAFQFASLGKDPFYLAGNKSLVESVVDEGNYQGVKNGQIFVLSEEHCLTRHALNSCKVEQKEKLNSFAPTSLTTLMQMTIYHQGLTFLPQMAVKKGIAGVSELTCEKLPESAYREIALVYRQRSYRQETFDILQKIISPLV